MRLTHLTNKILIADTKKLVGLELEATTKLLHHLKEIDKRKLYADYKYGSLFEYCIRELGYSEASAHRRIVAARTLALIPEIEEKIENGDLTLTNISLVNQFIKDHEERVEALKEVEGLTKKECEKKLFEITGKEEIPKEKKKRISNDKVQVSVVLSDETLAEIEKLRGLLAKELSMDELILFMTKQVIKSVEKDKFKQTTPRRSLSPAKVGRVVSAQVKRDVYKRDKTCSNCGSTHRLNFDHRVPYARGGTNDSENIRLLCFQCNQRARIRAGLKSHTDFKYKNQKF
jgi:hypothetical protein